MNAKISRFEAVNALLNEKLNMDIKNHAAQCTSCWHGIPCDEFRDRARLCGDFERAKSHLRMV